MTAAGQKNMSEKKWKVEFRYYEKPAVGYILPKLGEGWLIHYGADTKDTLHYHNLFEFGYCYHGKGELLIGDKEHIYGDDCFTAIPPNIPHTTEEQEAFDRLSSEWNRCRLYAMSFSLPFARLVHLSRAHLSRAP